MVQKVGIVAQSGDKKRVINKHGMRTAELLTPPQEAYARCRALGMSPGEASKACAGAFHEKTAMKWESTIPQVRARIEELSKLATNNAILKSGLDREWVISRLMQVVERCMQAQPVLDKNGNPTGEFKFDSNGANQALKMLGDTLGLFRAPDKKHDDEYATLSDDEIARIAHELASQTGMLQITQDDTRTITHNDTRTIDAG